MKTAEIRELSLDALQARLNDTREELMKLRFQQVTGGLNDTSRLRVLRREIACMLTIYHERMQSVEEGEK